MQAARAAHLQRREPLYAAVVDAYIQWQVALVEAVIRAALSGATAMHFRGHEHCIRRLANLLLVASAYRQGRKWCCECNCCLFVWGLRNYLAHHWTRDGAELVTRRSRRLWADLSRLYERRRSPGGEVT